MLNQKNEDLVKRLETRDELLAKYIPKKQFVNTKVTASVETHKGKGNQEQPVMLPYYD